MFSLTSNVTCVTINLRGDVTDVTFFSNLSVPYFRVRSNENRRRRCQAVRNEPIRLIAVRAAPDVDTGAHHERTGSWLMKAIVPVLPAVKVGIPEGRKEALIPGRLKVFQ